MVDARTDRLPHGLVPLSCLDTSLSAAASLPCVLQAPRVLKVKRVDRFQRTSIWLVENSESVV
jgi:hypothetical protein